MISHSSKTTCFAMLAGLTLWLNGCAEGGPSSVADGALSVRPLQGQVHGGQQPVAGASIQVWAVGTTGDGSAATPLLATPAISDSNGNFNLTGLYSCAPDAQVYLTGTGGNPGLSGGMNNPQLALMVAPGTCSQLQAMSFLTINELTTVAAVSELAPYMNDYSHIGYDSTDATDFVAAVSDAHLLVNPQTGGSPGSGLGSGVSVNADLVNTLGNLLAACVNSGGGVANDASACGLLFLNTTIAGVNVPADTIEAMLNMTLVPNQNVPTLFDDIPGASPFQPHLTTAPGDLSLQVSRSGLVFSPAYLALGLVSEVGPFRETSSWTNTSHDAIAWSASASGNTDSNIAVSISGCANPLPAGATCDFGVAFTGGHTVSRGTVAVTNVATNTVSELHLRGWSTNLVLSGPAVVGDGFIIAGTLVYCSSTCMSGASTIVISNTSSHPIALSGQFSSPGFSFGACPSPLAAGSSCTVAVSFYGDGGTTEANLIVTDITDGEVITLPGYFNLNLH